jgi:hypothetical protein
VEIHPVHVLRRGSELRRARLRYSGGRVLGSSFGKLHGLPGELSRGLDRVEEGGKGFGYGGCPRAALAGRREVAGAMGELRGVWRGTEDATGKIAEHWGGLYSRCAGMVTGRPRARGGSRMGVL